MTVERVPWVAVFGDDRAVEVEVGPGRGDVLLGAAAAAPGVNFFAIERRGAAAAAIRAAAARRGLDNVRVVAGDARCVIARLVPDASVTAYHIYFPDPWPKNRHRRRRLATDEFAGDLARTLAPTGTLHVASDLSGVVEEFATRLARAGLRHEPSASPPSRPMTAFERRYARAGTHYARWRRP
jgi:tRNA (guanine-N7-)-methyltransferase